MLDWTRDLIRQIAKTDPQKLWKECGDLIGVKLPERSCASLYRYPAGSRLGLPSKPFTHTTSNEVYIWIESSIDTRHTNYEYWMNIWCLHQALTTGSHYSHHHNVYRTVKISSTDYFLLEPTQSYRPVKHYARLIPQDLYPHVIREGIYQVGANHYALSENDYIEASFKAVRIFPYWYLHHLHTRDHALFSKFKIRSE